ncbi:hypothetical protein MAJHIDBO_00632 [Propionibacterium freudenreichii subsp. shermanii]|nr:hypothetical protein MAJHIDBO_00632 [Propionibacterium freudenreichii subsp. shermanii]SPS08448.1 hypothetical protein MAJHIDBO_00632 [Propionibacterium freudenreichii subsp. shermanii]
MRASCLAVARAAVTGSVESVPRPPDDEPASAMISEALPRMMAGSPAARALRATSVRQGRPAATGSSTHGLWCVAADSAASSIALAVSG